MGFEVGDKVKYVKQEVEHVGNIEIGDILEIIEKDGSNRPYRAIAKDKEHYWFYEGEIELVVNNKKPTKDELLQMPNGTRITTDLDNKYNVFYKADDEFYSDYSCMSLSDIEDDLSVNDDVCGTKIIKIEKPVKYETIYDYSTEVKEMTIADIEKALGHPVKIIKEDK